MSTANEQSAQLTVQLSRVERERDEVNARLHRRQQPPASLPAHRFAWCAVRRYCDECAQATEREQRLTAELKAVRKSLDAALASLTEVTAKMSRADGRRPAPPDARPEAQLRGSASGQRLEDAQPQQQSEGVGNGAIGGGNEKNGERAARVEEEQAVVAEGMEEGEVLVVGAGAGSAMEVDAETRGTGSGVAGQVVAPSGRQEPTQ